MSVNIQSTYDQHSLITGCTRTPYQIDFHRSIFLQRKKQQKEALVGVVSLVS